MADTVKTAISIEKGLYDEAEKVAATMNISRSKFYTIALERFLMERQNKMLVREINEHYQVDDSEDKKILEIMRKHRNKAIEREDW
jgi:hypothetical protein